jgi:hypothetical protein
VSDSALSAPGAPGDDLTAEERLNICRELELMLSDFWFDVDTNGGRRAADFYTEDGVFVASAYTYRGRDKIRQFYEYREARGPRTAAHTFTNFRLARVSRDHAVTTWYLVLYADDGAPVLDTAPPIQIGLSTDECVRGADGRWRYKHRRFDVWFKGGVPTPSPDLG